MTDIKILVLGVGSIGERHIKNLLELGYRNIILCRTIGQIPRTIACDYPTFGELDDALAELPDCVLICNPTHLHADSVIRCLEAGCSVFVEKPIATSTLDLLRIKSAISQFRKPVVVGYMMRYHPAIKEITSIKNDGLLGKPIHFRSVWGEFLPDWHPWEDYRKSYAARSDMGGGATLTLSHDIELALRLMGPFSRVSKVETGGSFLNTDCPELTDLVVKFESGCSGNIHLNYLAKPPERTIKIYFERGQVIFDYYKNSLQVYNYADDRLTKRVFGDFDRNDLFREEMYNFMQTVINQDPANYDLEIACDVVRLVCDENCS